ncbi:HlyD family efflux transporter periplasmic adaptor subunit [Microvirga tunisiensis]|uniref:HlyD family efflux transporter periplasmic adaptor subunit n=1 Tax=Pannonibacter tanglangensis TaxID=2750084 RepID=A0A7X5F1A4_9HYPH|nr:HlyD family efflux transporter periplasmic adaptor subunit [Pannonibacter sp. XCT-53]NBN76930.1 HlyD family efflux transporter periplasmic adaptor subunit [Pannonibacter sp. XCT-53]
MRFVLRSIMGFGLFAVMVCAIGYGVYHLHAAATAPQETRSRPPAERSFLANTATFEDVTVTPEITAYGQIRSWRTLQLRASSDGQLVEMSERFRDGAQVKAGDVLLRIDPAEATSRLLDARANLSDARSDKDEAEEAIVAAERELEATRKQVELRKQALERQRQLMDKGYSTMALVEQEQLSVAAIEQALNNRLQSVLSARKRIERSDFALKRAEVALKDAERILAETTVTAPFDGILDTVGVTLGRRVSPNEELANLIDPTALEVRFSVSTEQFSRLLGSDGQLLPQPVRVILTLGERRIIAEGLLERVAAVVGEGEAGRTLFASLDVGTDTVFRPGDFVTVEIEEPALSQVAVVPVSAATEDGRLLVVGADNRLEEIQARVLRRRGDELIVAGVPFGREYVRERLPQLGSGIRIERRQPAGAAAPVAQAPGAPSTAEGEMVRLEPERRAALLAQLAASAMPDDRKARLIEALNQPEVSRALVERIEARAGRRG